MADGPTSNIPGIVVGSESKEQQVNALFDAASQALTYGRNAATSSGLTWGFLGGNVVVADGSRVRVENGTLTLTASNTCYIVAAKADGAVSFATNTTNWDNTDDYWRLYSVVTGSATVTSWADHRTPGQYQGAGSGGGGAGWPSVTTNGGTAITLGVTDAGEYIQTTSSVAVTITVAPQSAEAWAADTEIHIEQAGTGAVDFVGGSGVTINHLAAVDPIIAGRYGVVTLKRVAEDVWTLFGALAEAAP